MNANHASPRRPRAILRIHFHPAERSEELYGQLLTVLDGISSRVEPLPADWSAYVDLTGALTYWGRDVEGLVAVLRLRLLALHGFPSSAGAGPTRIQWVRRFLHASGREPTAPRALPAWDNSGFASAGPPELVVAGRGWRA
ncbi:hypothetical protein [Streptomyces sp. D54]|uniref:hypothetical protein n=1 Tax=Streptomyces sp. D54 TaxID=1290289 RepID=UPI003CF7C503